MSKPPLIPGILAILAGLFAGIALLNKLGEYRWFWPYDQEVYGASLFVVVLEMAFVIPKLRPWFEAHQAKLDSEDGESL
jgi:hypothetical protein